MHLRSCVYSNTGSVSKCSLKRFHHILLKMDVQLKSLQFFEGFFIGDKFCVLVGSQHKSTPLIYMLDSSKHVPQLISKFEPSERFTNVSWAPAGGWLVVYSASTTSGAIMFIDSNGAEPTRTMLVEYPGFSKVRLSFMSLFILRHGKWVLRFNYADTFIYKAAFFGANEYFWSLRFFNASVTKCYILLLEWNMGRERSSLAFNSQCSTKIVTCSAFITLIIDHIFLRIRFDSPYFWGGELDI